MVKITKKLLFAVSIDALGFGAPIGIPRDARPTVFWGRHGDKFEELTGKTDFVSKNNKKGYNA